MQFGFEKCEGFDDWYSFDATQGEGTANEWWGLVASLLKNETFYAKRLGAVLEGDVWRIYSPRNSAPGTGFRLHCKDVPSFGFEVLQVLVNEGFTAEIAEAQ